MPIYRFSLVMDYISGSTNPGWFNIPGGFSESVYWTDISSSTMTSLRSLAQARALLLPNRSRVSGIRITPVDPKGSSALNKVNYAPTGGVDWDSDIPQSAISFSVPVSGGSNVSKRRIAAIPDKMSRFGEYAPTTLYEAAIRNYLRELNSWLMKGRDLTQAINNVISIDATGNVVLTAGVGYAINDTLTVRSTVMPNGKKVSGPYKVEAVTDATHFRLKGWNNGPTVLGTLQKYVAVYLSMRTATVDPNSFLIVTRKIGRPSKKYVGRRSKRRK